MSQENLYLDNKRVLKVSGLYCIEFLNNILTLDVSKLIPFEARPSALLSPQGRVLFDLLVSLDFQRHSKEKSILIEYDLLCEDDLIKKLNMYNLRKEVKVEKTSYKILVTINTRGSENVLKDMRFFDSDIHISRIYDENRLLDYQNKSISSNWYDLIRYKNCIPEGGK